MVEINGSENAYLLLFVIHFCDVAEDVVLAGESRREGQPRIGQVEVNALTYRRTQQRIATLINHTTVVHYLGAQPTIGWTGDALAVAQLCAPFAFLPGSRQVGEPVVIVAAGLWLPDTKRSIVGSHVLIAQTSIHIEL